LEAGMQDVLLKPLDKPSVIECLYAHLPQYRKMYHTQQQEQGFALKSKPVIDVERFQKMFPQEKLRLFALHSFQDHWQGMMNELSRSYESGNWKSFSFLLCKYRDDAVYVFASRLVEAMMNLYRYLLHEDGLDHAIIEMLYNIVRREMTVLKPELEKCVRSLEKKK
jgi:YesN/AraC family two-component response regulator